MTLLEPGRVDELAVIEGVGQQVADLLAEVQPMPTGVFLGRASAHSDAWHGLRSRGIGGSEVAAILGLSPWQSPFSLWHTKSAGWTREADDEQRWGSAIEPALLAWWVAAHPGARPWGVQGGTYAHRARPWQIGNPDGVYLDGDELVVVEAKKASSDDVWGAPGSDDVPTYYRVQAVHYLDVLGIRRADFVVTNLGRAPVFYRVDYDPEEARLIRGHAAAFWRSLVHGQAPDLDGTPATLQAVRRLHPDIDGTDVDVDPWTAVAWRIAKRRKDRADARAREATARLLAAMGAARRAFTPDGRPVARRQPARGGSVAVYEIGASK